MSSKQFILSFSDHARGMYSLRRKTDSLSFILQSLQNIVYEVFFVWKYEKQVAWPHLDLVLFDETTLGPISRLE